MKSPIPTYTDIIDCSQISKSRRKEIADNTHNPGISATNVTFQTLLLYSDVQKRAWFTLCDKAHVTRYIERGNMVLQKEKEYFTIPVLYSSFSNHYPLFLSSTIYPISTNDFLHPISYSPIVFSTIKSLYPLSSRYNALPSVFYHLFLPYIHYSPSSSYIRFPIHFSLSHFISIPLYIYPIFYRIYLFRIYFRLHYQFPIWILHSRYPQLYILSNGFYLLSSIIYLP